MKYLNTEDDINYICGTGNLRSNDDLCNEILNVEELAIIYGGYSLKGSISNKRQMIFENNTRHEPSLFEVA